jgi:hypothetical protein
MIPHGEIDSAKEAMTILESEVAKLRQLPLDELKRFIRPRALKRTGTSGRTYELEIIAMWEERKKRRLRVLVHVIPWWATGLVISTPRELTQDFLVEPS